MESKSVEEVAEATGLSEEQVKRKYPFSFGQVKPAKGTFKEGMSQAVDLGTDVAPILGTAKAVAELPEDAELIKQLIAAGYEEGDIKKMGMGGAYTALTVAGLIPGVKVAADIAKKGIKEGVEGAVEETATQTARALNVTTEKSPLRTLYEDLPETERAMLPQQPDEYGLYGYHGTASARGADEPFFDINFARTNDQFLGEGFYFTLDPEIASEYASLRSIGRNFEKTIKGDAARKILTAPNVQRQFVGGLGKDVSVHVTPGGDYVTVGSIMKGKNIYGEDIAQGQSISRFNLSNLEKPYVVRTEKQRKELKDKIPELKEQGYDSVLFADFKDRSKQIMVFPEHMEKIDTSAVAGRSASVSLKEADALEIGINPAMKEGALLRKYDASTVNSMVENASAANAGTKAANKLIGAKVPDGTQVGIRLNLNSTIPNMPRGLDKLQTLHQKNYNGKALSYRPFATVENVTFNVNQKGRQGIAAKIKGVDVPEAKNKFPAMSVDGQLNNNRNILDEMDDDVVEIAFNPRSGHLFVDMSTGQAVQSAEVATVVGDRVYAKGVTYMKKAEAPDPLSASDGTPLPSEVRYKMKKGGAVPMQKQMEMFEDGGLMDEGGTVDPVSGNDVPPGSTQEEVRDDIPAQLSEGEFVFPADVVRYIGLSNLMRMRQEAKLGLKLMEEMGQMGNSEEATMPDDLPFDINDLDMDDEPEYNVGGFVPGTTQQEQFGISGFQQAPMQTMGAATQPIQAASQQFVPQPITRPAQAYVPVQQVPTPLPTFGEITGPGVPEVDYEFATFRNEAGQEIQLKIKKGSQGELLPGEVLPDGYSWVDPTATQTEEVTTTPTTGQTATVRDTGDDDERDDGLGPGGGRIGMGGFSDGTGRKQNATIMGVSFDGMGEGIMGGIGGGLKTAASLAMGKPIPDSATATFTYDNQQYTISGSEYNNLKEAGYKGSLADKIVATLKTESGISRGSINYDAKTGTFKDKKSGETFQDKDDDGDGIGDILNKAGQSIYSNVDSNDLIKSGQKLNSSQKAVASAYNDAAFDAFRFDDDDDSDSAPAPKPSGSPPPLTKSSDIPSTSYQPSDDGPQPGGSSSSSRDFSAPPSAIGFGARAKGGLVEKPKPKAKKMKRGGLASKK